MMSHERRVREKRRQRRLITTTGCTDRRSHYYEKTRLAKSCDVWILYATVRRVTRAVSSTDNLRKWGFVKLFEEKYVRSRLTCLPFHFARNETTSRRIRQRTIQRRKSVFVFFSRTRIREKERRERDVSSGRRVNNLWRANSLDTA